MRRSRMEGILDIRIWILDLAEFHRDQEMRAAPIGKIQNRKSKIQNVSAPEPLAVPVHSGLGFNFDVAVDAGLAGETQFSLVPEPGEERDWAGQQAELLPQPLRADIFKPFGDVNPATGALPE